jgi:hypothetical protein
MNSTVRGMVNGRDRQTFVWETDFTSLADNLRILFRLHYRGRNQLFKLQKTTSDLR